MSKETGTEEKKKTAVELLAELDAVEAAEAKAKEKSSEELAEIELKNRAILKDLRAKFSCDLMRIDTDCGMVVVKAPEPQQQARFRKLVLVEETKASANLVLTTAAVVYPSLGEFEGWCKRKPILPDVISGHVTDLCGGETKAKKV